MNDDRLATLYRVHGPAIFARCLRLLHDRTAAEDATQETFLKVHRHLARVPGDGEARLWIFRVATNVCLSLLRTQRSRRDAPPDLSFAERSVEELLADRDLAAKLVARAPVKLGGPAWLHYVDGFDQGEVAELLGISRRTVINRLAKFVESSRKVARREVP